MTMLLDKAEQRRLAEAAGRSWAEARAEVLLGTIAAVHWPGEWDRRWARRLPFERGEVLPEDLAPLTALAAEAAAEHWARLVSARRLDESADDAELEEGARANQLLEMIAPNLPWQISADCDGPEIHLLDRSGQEWSVLSEEEAWRALSEWGEHALHHG